MILRLAGTAALMLVVAGPAFAVGPTCGKAQKGGSGSSTSSSGTSH